MLREKIDYRERFLQELGTKLTTLIEDENILATVMGAITVQLEKYELVERTTEVGFKNNSSEKLLQLYAGTLLTEGKSKKTVYGYIHFLKRFMYDINIQLLDVTTMDIKIWLAKTQENVSLRTCENYRSYLSSFYTWLQNEEFISKNPMAKIKPIKYIEEKKGILDDVEIDSIRMANKNVRDRAIFELLLSSGIRIAELCALNIEDIDFSKKSVLVREGKGGKQRVTYINDIAVVYLEKYLRQRNDNLPYLFVTRNNTRLTTDAARDCLAKMGKNAGVKDVHPHKCRRTFATTMHKKGMDIHSIQKLLGHTNINTTMIYIKSDDQALKAEYRKYA